MVIGVHQQNKCVEKNYDEIKWLIFLFILKLNSRRVT